MTVRATSARVFVWGTRVEVGLILLQFLLAGLGIFADAYAFFWHAVVNASAVFVLALLLAALGWYARVPRPMIWMSLAIAGLVILQSVFLVPYHMDDAPGALRAISSLHVVNALAIFWVAVQLVDRSRGLQTR